MKVSNLLENIPAEFSEELIEVIASSENVRIEQIISRGYTSPEDFWYDQDQNEFIVLLKGKAELEFFDPDNMIMLEEGDSLIFLLISDIGFIGQSLKQKRFGWWFIIEVQNL